MNSTEFILLHTTRYGDSSIILHTLSKEYGRKGFFVKNISRRCVSSVFFPLAILEADIDDHVRSRMPNVRNVSLRYALNGIRNNLKKGAISVFVSEVLFRVVKEGMQDSALYDMCERNILLLDVMESDFSNFHLYFLMEFIIALGFSPAPEDLEPFMGEHLSLMSDFISLPFSEAMLVPMSGGIRSELAERLLKYIEFHIESPVNVNSLKVLKELAI
ncbi:MAG TPA: recombination protein O N-terminal domain-containing protein [Candidatus Cryptobacteroides intestinipullorum]|nr:recombination protein O N-terminal domain-containing protein [Candidatus Cryptobacteroides intestinipullorum]